jgi:hypothetical protein
MVGLVVMVIVVPKEFLDPERIARGKKAALKRKRKIVDLRRTI